MAKPCVMIADNDKRNVGVLSELFMDAGYSVLPCYALADVMEAFFKHLKKIDLIIIDIFAHGAEGIETLKKIRDVSKTPVVVVSARAGEGDQLAGFGHGADDYVAKPYAPKLVLARVKNILKRGKTPEESLDYGAWQFFPQSGFIVVNGAKARLTPKENNLLIYFAHNAGAVLSRERLLNAVWDVGFYGGERTVDTHVKQLRAKIGETGAIETVRGGGYRFTLGINP